MRVIEVDGVSFSLDLDRSPQLLIIICRPTLRSSQLISLELRLLNDTLSLLPQGMTLLFVVYIPHYPLHRLRVKLIQNATNWAIHANFDTDMFDTVPDSLQPSRSSLDMISISVSFIYYCSLDITSSITYSSSFQLTDLGPVDADAYDVVDDVNMVPIEVIPQLPAATKRLELEFEL